MGRFTFWILLAACLMAAGAVYVLKVDNQKRDVEKQARELDAISERGLLAAENAIGDTMLIEQSQQQITAQKTFEATARWFEDRNAQNLSMWFPTLNMRSWAGTPSREDFKRFYNLAVDQLIREVADDLRDHGLEGQTLQLVSHPWMRGDEIPDKADLRALQREFWVQDRLVRAFARAGAVLARPIQGGESQSGVGVVAGGGPFNRIRYDVRVLCQTRYLEDVLHALDAPFDITHEDGTKELAALPVIVNNVLIQRLNVDATIANRYPEEPPVEVTFFLTVLDFDGTKTKG